MPRKNQSKVDLFIEEKYFLVLILCDFLKGLVRNARFSSVHFFVQSEKLQVIASNFWFHEAKYKKPA